VPKATNNPFFDAARDGCKKAAAEIGGISCYYIGPNEHGGGDEQLQAVQDLIAKHVDGIAVSAANAAAMAQAGKKAKAAAFPSSPGTAISWTRTRRCAPPISARSTSRSASRSRSA
jgi:ribose transport system substrate-binding protein